MTVTVADDDGGTDTKTFQVTVANVAPLLAVVGDQSTSEGRELESRRSRQVHRPGIWAWARPSATRSTGAMAARRASGDGTIDTPGRPGVVTAGSFDGSHTYADNGVYVVQVSVSDDDTGTDTKTFMVTVNNVAPTLTVVRNQRPVKGHLTIPNLGTFTDPGYGAGETFTFTINWGDGTARTLARDDQVLGSADVLTAGSFDG